jgi:NPCBM/NEW2 domain
MKLHEGGASFLKSGRIGGARLWPTRCRRGFTAKGSALLMAAVSVSLLLGGVECAKAALHAPAGARAQAIRPGETPLTSLPIAQEGGAYQTNAVTFGGQSYAKALQIHGTGYGPDAPYLEYYLGKRCSRFRALVGASDFANDSFKVVYVVIGDGQELYRSPPLRVGSEPQPIDINVTGVLRLRLLAEMEHYNWEFNDRNAFWVNPRVFQDGEAPRPTVAKIILDGNPLVTVAPIVQGEPCLPLSVLQKLKGSIRRVDWNASSGEVVIESR